MTTSVFNDPSPFERWMEKGGAGQRRSTRTQLVHIRFLEAVRAQLPADPNVTVGQALTDAQLATILQRIESTTP